MKLPLPSKSEMMLNLEVEVLRGLGKGRAAKCCNNLGQISCVVDERLKRMLTT